MAECCVIHTVDFTLDQGVKLPLSCSEMVSQVRIRVAADTGWDAAELPSVLCWPLEKLGSCL